MDRASLPAVGALLFPAILSLLRRASKFWSKVETRPTLQKGRTDSENEDGSSFR
jgi:hypothetical protein